MFWVVHSLKVLRDLPSAGVQSEESLYWLASSNKSG